MTKSKIRVRVLAFGLKLAPETVQAGFRTFFCAEVVLRHKADPHTQGMGSTLSKQLLAKKMPNAKVLIDGKWLAFVKGVDGVSNIFASKEEPSTLVVLSKEGITSYTGFPFLLERDYASKKDIEA